MARSGRLGTVRKTPIAVPSASASTHETAERSSVIRSPARSHPRKVVSPVGTDRANTSQFQWYPMPGSVAALVDGLVVRALEQSLHFVAHGEVEVQPLRRDRMAEPLVV